MSRGIREEGAGVLLSGIFTFINKKKKKEKEKEKEKKKKKKRKEEDIDRSIPSKCGNMERHISSED